LTADSLLGDLKLPGKPTPTAWRSTRSRSVQRRRAARHEPGARRL